MKKSPLFFSLSAGVVGLGGCMSPVGAVREAVATAPEWYQEARVEIRGEGYPDLTRVVALENRNATPSQAAVAKLAVADAETLLLDDIFNAPPEEALEEALAWANEEQAAFDDVGATDEFLTEDELEALRALFEVGRANP